MLRKVAVAAASNPHVEIRQDGEKFYIKTSTSVRTTEINFHIGEEFDEETVDGRKCKVSEWVNLTVIGCSWSRCSRPPPAQVSPGEGGRKTKGKEG